MPSARARKTLGLGTAAILVLALVGPLGSTSAAVAAPDRRLPILERSSAAPLAGADASTTDVVPGEVLVRWKPGVSTGSRQVVRQARKTRLLQRLSLERTEQVAVPAGSSVEATVRALKADPRVESAQPNFRYLAQTPEPGESLLWGLNNTGQNPEPGFAVPGVPDVDINAPEAWAQPVGGGSASVVVAVIDTGIDTSHIDLAGGVWTNPGEVANNGLDDDGNGFVDDVNGWDFLNGNKSVYDGVTCLDGANEDFHGTHVAGTIAARRNGAGIVGVAYGIKYMPVKALGCEGGTTATVVDALEYASANGAKIANMSLGGPGFDGLFKSAIEASGMLVVAAAGNGGSDGIGDNNDTFGADWPSYPAAFDSANVLSVAAVDNRGARTGFSNYGATSVDVGAPGASILSTYPGNQLIYLDGTSMAAPHVAGVAALVASTNGALNTSQIKARIMSTVRPLASLSGTTMTGGLVDAEGAVLGAAVPLTATTIAIARSASTITYGQPVTHSTRLLGGSAAAAGRSVQMQRYSNGWKTVCSGVTNSGGYASCVQYLGTSSSFRWRFGGDIGLAASWSATSSIAVRPVISASLSPSTISLGRTAYFSGAISPSKKGSVLRLQRKVGNSWVTVSKTAVTSRNTYSFAIKPGSRGYITLRVYFYGDAASAAQSTSTRTLRVR